MSVSTFGPGQLVAGERMNVQEAAGAWFSGRDGLQTGRGVTCHPLRPPAPPECARWRLRAAHPALLAGRPQHMPPRSGAADACHLASAGPRPAWPVGSTSKCHGGRGQACQRGDERSPRQHVPGLPAVTAVWRRQPSKEAQGRTAALPGHRGSRGPRTTPRRHQDAPGEPKG